MTGCADFHDGEFSCGTVYGDMYGGHVWWICMVDMYEWVCMNMYEWWVLWSRPVTSAVKLIRQSFDRC